MSKQDVNDEHKQSDGNPETKARDPRPRSSPPPAAA